MAADCWPNITLCHDAWQGLDQALHLPGPAELRAEQGVPGEGPRRPLREALLRLHEVGGGAAGRAPEREDREGAEGDSPL